MISISGIYFRTRIDLSVNGSGQWYRHESAVEDVVMAREGKKFRNILQLYYQGLAVEGL